MIFYFLHISVCAPGPASLPGCPEPRREKAEGRRNGWSTAFPFSGLEGKEQGLGRMLRFPVTSIPGAACTPLGVRHRGPHAGREGEGRAQPGSTGFIPRAGEGLPLRLVPLFNMRPSLQRSLMKSSYWLFWFCFVDGGYERTCFPQGEPGIKYLQWEGTPRKEAIAWTLRG